ncbi:leukocyte immunoglobulin-like receptor subfamily B member 5 [Lissotriton helveticus]
MGKCISGGGDQRKIAGEMARWRETVNPRSQIPGLLPKPSLLVTSGSVTVRGGNLTLSCAAAAPYRDMTFVLFRGVYSVPPQDPPGTEAVFHFTDVDSRHEGKYHCQYYSKEDNRIKSELSDAVDVTRLREVYPKPSVVLSPGSQVTRGGTLTIKCTSDYPNMRFFLYNGSRIYLKEDPPGSEAVFVIRGVQRTDEGPYECRYHPRSGEPVWSDASEPFRIQVVEKQQETSTATTPRNMDTTLTIAVVCAVLLVVILGVAFILYIKCKPKKAKDDIQKRNLPLNEEKKTDSLEPMYAIVTKVNTSNNTIAPEVKKQEEGGYDEGPTYAVINKDALKNKKNNSAPPFQQPEPTLYASVNIH